MFEGGYAESFPLRYIKMEVQPAIDSVDSPVLCVSTF